MTYGVRSEYELSAGRKRDYLTVWSGPFYSVFEASAVSLPKRDGYMLTTYNGDKVRVTCPLRTDDAAISAALAAHYVDARHLSA
jgi:hypothetical protein